MRDERSDMRLIERKRVFTGKLINVDRDRIELPTGVRTDLELISHPGAAACVPFIDDQTVVLVRQYRHAVGSYLLEIPAGTLEANESPAHCVRRELIEETGLSAERFVELGEVVTTPGFTDERIWLYEAHDLSATDQRLEPDEVIHTVKMPFTQAIAAVADGTIIDGKSIAALLKAAQRRR